jgi:hypothetical protein
MRYADDVFFPNGKSTTWGIGFQLIGKMMICQWIEWGTHIFRQTNINMNMDQHPQLPCFDGYP